jgi:hypothetical protein
MPKFEDDAPDHSQVRHFFLDDRHQAELVVRLAALHLKFDVTAEFQPWASGDAEPGELWLLLGRTVEKPRPVSRSET